MDPVLFQTDSSLNSYILRFAEQQQFQIDLGHAGLRAQRTNRTQHRRFGAPMLVVEYILHVRTRVVLSYVVHTY